MDWDGLAELDLGSVLRLRPRSGQMEALSLTATYEFTFAEYAEALPGSRPARTVLHETTHAYQALGTSYGYYYGLLRAFQNGRTLSIMHLLGEAGVPLRPPLIRQVLRGRGGAAEQARVELNAWYLAELVLLYLEGDIDILERQMQAVPAVMGRTLHGLFHELEEYLVQFLAAVGHRVDKVEESPVEDERAAEDSLLQFTLKATLPGWGDTVSVLESGGRIAEYWRTWPDDAARYDEDMPHDTAYSFWIRQARRWDISDGRSFALTFAALADLALNPPVLPHQAALRPAGLPMRSLSPTVRMLNGLGAVGSGAVAPIRDLARDYAGFVEGVCAASGWPTPMAMTAPTVAALPGEDDVDPPTRLYRLAQVFRNYVPEAFVDLDVWSLDDPSAALFRSSYVHPIIQFSDRSLQHRDRATASAFLQAFALNQYLRQLMLVGDRPVELPARLGAGELAAANETSTAMLRDLLGPGAPAVRLVSAPAAGHRAEGGRG